MMPLRRAWLAALACACAIAGLAGCSGGTRAVRCLIPPARAYALEVTTAGRVRWQVPVAAPAGVGSGPQLPPLAVGAVAVFARGDDLYGLRLTDGHRLWSRASGEDNAGLWRWQNLVVVLTQPGSSGLPPAVLTGLDASTGQARWTLRMRGSVDGFSPTADGGMAILSEDGTLEVVDLSSGRVRWTRAPGLPDFPADSPMAVAGDSVLVAANGRLTSYDDRTGQVRWTDELRPVQDEDGTGELVPQAAAGLVYVTGAHRRAGQYPTPDLLGIRVADGRLKWRFVPRHAGSLDAYAAGLVSVASISGTTTWQDELDEATGRVRWRVASADHALATPAGTVTGPETVNEHDGAGAHWIARISMHDSRTGQTRWTSAWLSSLPDLLGFPAGPLLIEAGAGPDGSGALVALRMSDGHRAWQVSIPASAAAPLSALPGGVLVYAATTSHVCTQPP